MFNERLIELRKNKNFNQTDIANILNISRSAVALWETGKRIPDTDMLAKIANYFNTTIDYLLGRTDIKSPPELIVPESLKEVSVAFHRGEFEGLTQSEIDALASIAETLKAQRLRSAEDDKT